MEPQLQKNLKKISLIIILSFLAGGTSGVLSNYVTVPSSGYAIFKSDPEISLGIYCISNSDPVIRLSWQTPDGSSRISIFRSVNGLPESPIAKGLDSRANNYHYQDENVAVGSEYKYYLITDKNRTSEAITFKITGSNCRPK